MTFRLPGYEIERLLGRGSTGEVWLARESATGEYVALKRLIPGGAGAGDAISAAWLQREAALLVGVAHDHVVALRATVPTADGLVLVLEYAAGGSLAHLLAARGRLTPGELVTVGAPLAQALAGLHARGLVHGDVTPGNVLFTAEGKPLLSDLGVAVLLDERPREIGATAGFADPVTLAGQPPSAASDVFGLAAVCFAALIGEPPETSRLPMALEQLRLSAPPGALSLVEAIAAALSPQRGDRPDVASFGRQLFDAYPPEPVRLVRPDPPHSSGHALFDGAQPPTHRVAVATSEPPTQATMPAATSIRTRLVRRLGAIPAKVAHRAVVVVVAIVLLAGAVMVGTWWAGREQAPGVPVDADSTSQTSGPASPSAPASTVRSPKAAAGETEPSNASAVGWREAVAELDQVRDAAFAARDSAALARVYAPGSAALATDRASVEALTSAGLRVQGLELRLLDVQPVAVAADGVTLEVVDELPPYRLIAADGAVRHLPGRDRATWRITLVQGQPGGWRISDIVHVG